MIIHTRPLLCLAVIGSVTRAAVSAGRRARPVPHVSPSGGARFLVSKSRPALAKILIGDATNPVCESVFRSRGHDVDVRPGLPKVRSSLLECVCIAQQRIILISFDEFYAQIHITSGVRMCLGG